MVSVAQAKTQNFDAQVADFLIPMIKDIMLLFKYFSHDFFTNFV